MRIALFTDTYPPQVNGVARTLARLVRHAIDRGHEVAVVTPRQAAPAPAEVSMSVELNSIPAPLYPGLRLALPLDPWNARRLRAFAPDIVHVATEFTVGWSGATWASKQRVPLITSFHTDFPAYLSGYGLGGLEQAAWRWLAAFHGKALLTFCPSHATLAQLRDAGFHDRLRVWTRGVDAATFTPERRCETVRQRLAPDADTILMYVGRLAPEKRLGLLLDAFGRVHARSSRRIALAIVGDGPSRDELQRKAGPDVIFTGWLAGDELADTYAAADIFAFPSDTETFGNVVLEAMASGVPVVAPARGGVTDTVHPDINGELFAVGGAEAFAVALERLIADDDRRVRLAAGARSHALGQSWTAILDDLLDAYAETAEQAVRAA